MNSLKGILIIKLLFTLTSSAENPDFMDSDYSILFSKRVNWSNLVPPDQLLGITNGKEVIPHSYPFQVFLRINLDDYRNIFCGGTLITRRFVLTAAHCLKGTFADRKTCFNAKNLTVIVGAHDFSEKETSRAEIYVRRIKIHEKYNRKIFANDIALLELDCPVVLGYDVRTVRLVTRNDKWKNLDGKKAKTIGWGTAIRTPSIFLPVLKEFDSDILPLPQCWIKYPRNLRKTNICLNSKNSSQSCHGDSGSPLLIDGVQVGVTSFGVRSCTPCFPTVFTRITSYIDWIERNSDYDFAETETKVCVEEKVCDKKDEV